MTALCQCKDRVASGCPGEWEPGCDLGNNPAHARGVDPAESAAGKVKQPGPRMTITGEGDASDGHWFAAEQLRTYGDQCAAAARHEALEDAAKACEARGRSLEAARAYADGSLQGANPLYWGPLISLPVEIAAVIRQLKDAP